MRQCSVNGVVHGVARRGIPASLVGRPFWAQTGFRRSTCCALQGPRLPEPSAWKLALARLPPPDECPSAPGPAREPQMHWLESLALGPALETESPFPPTRDSQMRWLGSPSLALGPRTRTWARTWVDLSPGPRPPGAPAPYCPLRGLPQRAGPTSLRRRKGRQVARSAGKVCAARRAGQWRHKAAMVL